MRREGEWVMSSREFPTLVCAPFLALALSVGACSSSPPPEQKGDTSSRLSAGDDDDDVVPTQEGGDDDDVVAASGSGLCTCKVESNYDNGDFYDSREACEASRDGRGQGTDTFVGSCDQDGQSIVGYVRDQRMNYCAALEFFLRCDPVKQG
jgi:hypothetical protein